MRFGRPAWLSKQIPLITLIAVLLNLCVFTFQYASTRVHIFVIIFNWLRPIGGILLACLFWVFFGLLLYFIYWLITDIVMGRR
jgi:hypothetical protein